MKIWVVIPAYNEGEVLGDLLEKLRRKGLSTIVVDDGSNDKTYEIANRQADLVIRNERNLGKGISLNRAITYLLQNTDFDYIITMDADGQHSPDDIDEFIRKANGGASFVVGSRMNNPIGMPKIRVITNKLMSWIISKICRQKIPDTQCGFRLIRREVLEKVTIETRKFEIESEILIKSARLGFPIESIPIKSIYFKNPRSKIHPFIDTLRFFRFIFSLDKSKK
jgi:glycosyltransferase involved in cell wall biosynthesis